MTLRALARQVLPPILVDALRSAMKRRASRDPDGPRESPEYAYVPEGWAYAHAHGEVRGWNVPDVLDTYKRKWPRFVALVEGTGPLGLSHESDLSTVADLNSQNTILAFAYALALAAHRLDTLSMLDWGGGIGHYYVLARSLLPGVRIDYHCVDVPLLAAYGTQILPKQRFSADESWQERSFDFVLASGALHYTENWQGVLTGLAGAARGYLLVSRLPTVLQTPSFVFVQRPYAYGYNTEYLGWCLNRTALLEEADRRGAQLVREFILAERPPIHGAPEQCQYRGFLFRRAP